MSAHQLALCAHITNTHIQAHRWLSFNILLKNNREFLKFWLSRAYRVARTHAHVQKFLTFGVPLRDIFNAIQNQTQDEQLLHLIFMMLCSAPLIIRI